MVIFNGLEDNKFVKLIVMVTNAKMIFTKRTVLET